MQGQGVALVLLDLYSRFFYLYHSVHCWDLLLNIHGYLRFSSQLCLIPLAQGAREQRSRYDMNQYYSLWINLHLQEQ